MLNRQCSSDSAVRIKPWWFFTILSVIAFVCVSCSDMAPFQGKSMHSLHLPASGTLPLTDSAPPQGDVIPTVPASPPHGTQVSATPTPILPASNGDASFWNMWAGPADHRPGSNQWYP